MHEVVTLQFGQQANYLGTHYWNTQESYFTYAGQADSPIDHDVSFRAGIGADGSDTYTPRTLIYDLKGAFGTLRRENALYELQQQEHATTQGPWSGSTIPLQLPPIAPSPYQRALDQGVEPPQLTTETVRFWSDYNHIFYHPRSIVQLNEYELNSSLMPFEKWQTGEELFANLDREHDLLDRDLRPFLEECDQLQALQIISSVDDAWGGFASRYLERIADDLGKGCRWIFGLQDGRRAPRERQMVQLTNAAYSLQNLNSSTSIQAPITSHPASLPRYLSSLDRSSLWHASAMQCVLVESITLPTRLHTAESGRATFEQLETTLNNDGNRRVVAAAISVDDPAHLQEERDSTAVHDVRMTNGISDELENETLKLDMDFFPSMHIVAAESNGQRLGNHQHVFSSIQSLRGPWTSDTEIESSNASSRDPVSRGPRTNTFQSPLLFPILSSFPRLYNFSTRPQSVAVKAAISTSTMVADRIRELERTAGRFAAVEERESLCDGLASMAEEYEEGWSGGDDSDDND